MAATRPPIPWVVGLIAIPALAAIGFIAGAEPKFGIVAALALVYALIVFSDLSIALTLLIVIVFAESTPLAGPALSATKIAGLLLALGWIARTATSGERQRSVIFVAHPVLSYLLALFLGWITLSIIWAEDPALAVEQATVFLLVAVLYVIVYTAVRTRKQAFWVDRRVRARNGDHSRLRPRAATRSERANGRAAGVDDQRSELPRRDSRRRHRPRRGRVPRGSRLATAPIRRPDRGRAVPGGLPAHRFARRPHRARGRAARGDRVRR